MTALSGKANADGRPVHVDVTAPQRRQPVGVVRRGVALVADSHVRALEERDDQRHHSFEAQTGRSQVLVDPLAQAAERLTEHRKVVELRLLALGAKLGVVPVLLAPARVAARCLQVTVCVVADPHVGPRWGYGELTDALEDLVTRHDAPTRESRVAKSLRAGPSNPRLRVGDIPQARSNRYHHRAGLPRHARG